MRVTRRAVTDLARNSGLPEDVIARYLEELIQFTFVVAKRERKANFDKIRAWVHDGSVIKPNILDVLRPNRESEEDEVYDLL